MAAYNGYTKTIAKLIERGADFDAVSLHPDLKNDTALFLTIRERNVFNNLIQSTKALLKAGADPTILSQEPVTNEKTGFIGIDAFDFAIFKNNFEAV